MASAAIKEASLNLVSVFEGGLTDIKGDTGGLTNYGISFTFLKDRHIDINGDGVISNEDIKALTKERVRLLYSKYFWNAVHGDELPNILAPAVYDCSVNQGVGYAIRTLQQCCHAYPDGIIGKKTIKACNSNIESTLRDFLTARMIRYTECKLWPTCKRGWTRRLVTVALFCGGVR